MALTAGGMARWGPAQRGHFGQSTKWGSKGPHLSRWDNGFLSPEERNTGGKWPQEPSASSEIHGSLNAGKVILSSHHYSFIGFMVHSVSQPTKNVMSTSHVPGPRGVLMIQKWTKGMAYSATGPLAVRGSPWAPSQNIGEHIK